jgi:hypothetical protein
MHLMDIYLVDEFCIQLWKHTLAESHSNFFVTIVHWSSSLIWSAGACAAIAAGFYGSFTVLCSLVRLDWGDTGPLWSVGHPISSMSSTSTSTRTSYSSNGATYSSYSTTTYSSGSSTSSSAGFGVGIGPFSFNLG